MSTDMNESLGKADNPGRNVNSSLQNTTNTGIHYQVYGIWVDVTKAENDLLISKEKIIMPNTKIELTISGDAVSNIRKTINFDLLSKDEDIQSIDSSDGWSTVDLSRLKNFRSLIMFSQLENIPFDVRITINEERVIVTGFETPADNGIYYESGLVNGRKKFVIENGSYLQWNSTLTRWEKYTPVSVLEAYSNTSETTPDLVALWIKASDFTYYTSIKMILFNAEPMILKCRDFFSMFPSGDDFMATVSKIEIRTSNGTPVGIFISSLGSQ